MSSSKINATANTGSLTRSSFNRKYTHIDHAHIDSLRIGRPAVWKAAHAVLNASAEGCLTTEEIEKGIRAKYGKNNFAPATLKYYLSLSKDFEQVPPNGRQPGLWFLTGETKGVQRATPKRDRKLPEAASMSSASISSADIATGGGDPPVKQLPYSIEIEGNRPAPTLPSWTPQAPLPTHARTTLSPPSRLVRMLDTSEPNTRPSVGYRPDIHPSAVPALVDSGKPVAGPSAPDVPYPAPKLMPCGAEIPQQVLRVAYHAVLCMFCTVATPIDEWCSYYRLAAEDAIHYDLSTLPTAPSDQPEVHTAGLRLDASFEIPGPENQFGM